MTTDIGVKVFVILLVYPPLFCCQLQTFLQIQPQIKVCAKRIIGSTLPPHPDNSYGFFFGIFFSSQLIGTLNPRSQAKPGNENFSIQNVNRLPSTQYLATIAGASPLHLHGNAAHVLVTPTQKSN